jgi:hypothetical protein
VTTGDSEFVTVAFETPGASSVEVPVHLVWGIPSYLSVLVLVVHQACQ